MTGSSGWIVPPEKLTILRNYNDDLYLPKIADAQSRIDISEQNISDLQSEIDSLSVSPDGEQLIEFLEAQKAALEDSLNGVESSMPVNTTATGVVAEDKATTEATKTEMEAWVTKKESILEVMNPERNSLEDNINSLSAEYQKILAEIIDLTAAINRTALEIKAIEKRKAILENIPETKQVSAWCADLTEDLTGEIGLIEVPGEGQSYNIMPGYVSAAYDQSRDGQLMPTLAMTPAQAFYSLAMLPGWQKWMPTFRYATIESIDGDTADITLESAESSQQSIDVNQPGSLSGVDIEYMNCDGYAFEEGDSVLVHFENQDFARPKIIGFKDNPKRCNPVIVILQSGDKVMFLDLLTEKPMGIVVPHGSYPDGVVSRVDYDSTRDVIIAAWDNGLDGF